jgi:hypothetical protein
VVAEFHLALDLLVEAEALLVVEMVDKEQVLQITAPLLETLEHNQEQVAVAVAVAVKTLAKKADIQVQQEEQGLQEG